MSTTPVPQMVPQRRPGGQAPVPRAGPGWPRRNLGPLLLAGVLIVGVVAVVAVRAWSARHPSGAGQPPGPLPTTLTLPALAAVYGDRELVLTALVAGEGAAVGEGAVTFTIATDRGVIAIPASVRVADGRATVGATLPADLPAGAYTVEAVYDGTAAFGGSRATAQLTVAPATAALALVPASLAQVYDGTPKAALATSQPGDLPLTIGYRRDGAAVAAPLGAGTYEVEATVADPNYRGTVRGTLTIARAAPEVTWPPPNAIVYGTPLSAAQLDATAALAGSFTYDPPLGAILPAGSGRALTATFAPADGANYQPVTVGARVTVAPAPLTILAGDASRVYGAANPPLAATMRGFVNGETAAVLEGAPLVTTAATPGSPVGTYPIAVTPGQVRAANYVLILVPGRLTVTPAPLTIAARDAARVYGAPDPPFGGALTGVVNDDPIAATYRTTATIGSPVGQYPIAPVLDDPAGRLGNYLIASTPGTLTVTPAPSATIVPEVRADEGQTATLQASVQPVGPAIVGVDEGRVSFTVRQGERVVAAPPALAVKGGVATVALPLGDLDAGTYTVDVAYSGGGNFADSTGAGALVVANVAPTAVLLGPAGAVAEGDEFTVTLADPSDPSAADRAAGFTYAFDRGDGRGFGPATATNAATRRALDDPGMTVRARVYDQHGAWTEYSLRVAVANVAPTLGPIAGPGGPVTVGATVTAGAAFADPGVLDQHEGTWDWGDGATTPARIEAANGSGAVEGGHAYGRAGLYTLTLTLRDDAQGTARAVFRFVVVDAGDGGAAAGFARFDSPAGAIAARPAQSGPATLAFVAGAEPGATPPVDTRIAFEVGDLHFASTSYDWLLIGGSLAQIEGVGAVNGTGGYHFLLTATDGESSGGADHFRLAIWDPASGALVYDSQPGAAREAAPATIPTSGDIVIHPRERDRIYEAGQSLSDRISRLVGP